MRPPAPDGILEQRQTALQAQARQLVLELGLLELLSEVGPVRFAGSYVSALMSWPEIDVMVLAGPNFSQGQVQALQMRIITHPHVVGVEYHDQRGPRSPTGETRDERYHLVTRIDRRGVRWCVDLSVWLHDEHANVTAWHEALRESITTEQRLAVLRIKDVWHQDPTTQTASAAKTYTTRYCSTASAHPNSSRPGSGTTKTRPTSSSNS
jgi:hypothetical protein